MSEDSPPTAEELAQWRHGILAVNEKGEQYWDGPALRLIDEVERLRIMNQAPLLGELEAALSRAAEEYHYGWGHRGAWMDCYVGLCPGIRDFLLRVRQAREGIPEAPPEVSQS
jgi:hypothetical protein